MNISRQQGPFKTSYVSKSDGVKVCRVFTYGESWSVKALDGRLWDAGNGFKTDTRNFHTYQKAIKFINSEFEAR